jgi:hypothetical protein
MRMGVPRSPWESASAKASSAVGAVLMPAVPASRNVPYQEAPPQDRATEAAPPRKRVTPRRGTQRRARASPLVPCSPYWCCAPHLPQPWRRSRQAPVLLPCPGARLPGPAWGSPTPTAPYDYRTRCVRPHRHPVRASAPPPCASRFPVLLRSGAQPGGAQAASDLRWRFNHLHRRYRCRPHVQLLPCCAAAVPASPLGRAPGRAGMWRRNRAPRHREGERGCSVAGGPPRECAGTCGRRVRRMGAGAYRRLAPRTHSAKDAEW